MKLFGIGSRIIAVSYLALCAACGSGSGDSGSGGGNSPPPPPPPAGIGAAGGTVTEASGAKVVIPASALAAQTDIAVTQSLTGAPALPAGVTAFGPIYAFTPHGTAFAVPARITVPFDPTKVPAGTTLALYKTNATLTTWDVVAGATVSGSTMVGDVSGFSDAVVASVPIEKRTDLTEKTWTLKAFDIESDGPVAAIEDLTQVGGEVFRQVPIGTPLVLAPPGSPFPEATLEVFSNDTGATFWTIAQAPRGSEENPINTGTTELTQTFTFKRPRGAVSSLHFVLSGAFLEALDSGGAGPSLESCPWLDPTLPTAEIVANCVDFMMQANIRMRVEAIKVLAPAPFYTLGSDARLTGAGNIWNFSLLVPPDTTGALWHEQDFTLKDDGSVNAGTDGRHALVELKTPFTVTIPLDGNVGDDETFTVTITMFSAAENRVGGESYVAAYIRDPLQAKGLEMNFTGLEQVPVQHVVPAAQVQQACPTNPDPAAGMLQFSALQFRAPESLRDATIVVERAGGTRGDISVLLETSDGTAAAGSDYQSVRSVVRFADGEGGKHAITIPLAIDDIAEPDERVNLKLSMFSGCATLGGQSTATLVIQDDDRPLPVTPTFTLGGTVTGLAGSGLALRTNFINNVQPSANGSFTFPRTLDDGTSYSISIETQPVNPAQICSVTNGSGTIAGANVTNVLVNCTTPTGNFTIGGAVTGLHGTGLVLRNNGGNDLTVAASGAVTFSSPLASDSAYSVVVKTQPVLPGQICAVTNGKGKVSGANVTNVVIECVGSTFADTDRDGLTDEIEATLGTDPTRADSDGDSLGDGEEVLLWRTDPLNTDTEGDHVSDNSEVANGTDPNFFDTDGDLIADNVDPNPRSVDGDGDGVLDIDDPFPLMRDADGGGASDGAELAAGTDPFAPGDDRPSTDSDSDFLTDNDEFALGTDPFNPDSDGDRTLDGVEAGVCDPLKIDTDGDTLKDSVERAAGLICDQPDSDHDGLADNDEVGPSTPDQDDDGLIDGVEERVYHSFSGVQDTDNDRLNDGDEVKLHRTDPIRADTDCDGVNDGQEVDNGTDPLHGPTGSTCSL